jgi:UDP-2,3-diacylglucosamine pyrophosphatase LpxH
MRIYCASDFHIGYEKAHYPAILKFFDLVRKEKPDKLILCGDILDLWLKNLEAINSNKKTRKAFKALLSVTKEVDTTYIWGNHDYNVEHELQKNDIIINAEISDSFVLDNIFFCHGWRFDLQQRALSVLYGWLVTNFPILYQMFFTSPFELKEEEEKARFLSKHVHREAREHIKKKKLDYLIMGHTHDPYGKNKLFDCGDMIDSLSYVVLDDGKPNLERIPRN